MGKVVLYTEENHRFQVIQLHGKQQSGRSPTRDEFPTCMQHWLLLNQCGLFLVDNWSSRIGKYTSDITLITGLGDK